MGQNSKLKIHLLWALLIIPFLLVSCGGVKNDIVGRWEHVDGSGDSFEFFEDGTVASHTHSFSGFDVDTAGEYKMIGDNQIRLDIPDLIGSQVFGIDISDDILTLTLGDGVYRYQKVNSKREPRLLLSSVYVLTPGSQQDTITDLIWGALKETGLDSYLDKPGTAELELHINDGSIWQLPAACAQTEYLRELNSKQITKDITIDGKKTDLSTFETEYFIHPETGGYCWKPKVYITAQGRGDHEVKYVQHFKSDIDSGDGDLEDAGDYIYKINLSVD